MCEPPGDRPASNQRERVLVCVCACAREAMIKNRDRSLSHLTLLMIVSAGSVTPALTIDRIQTIWTRVGLSRLILAHSSLSVSLSRKLSRLSYQSIRHFWDSRLARSRLSRKARRYATQSSRRQVVGISNRSRCCVPRLRREYIYRFISQACLH